MRTLLTAAILGTTALAAASADAQVYRGGNAPIPAPGGHVRMQGPRVQTAGPRVWQNGRWNALPPSHNVARNSNSHRWGNDRNGRWDAGGRAPGGWGAYRRLGRGHRLPQYWMSGSFGISDYLTFGLASPPRGYHWVRYYDDAVLVDYEGNVWDTQDGITWGGAEAWSDDGYASANSESYSYSSGGAGYAQPMQPVDPNGYYAQQQYPGGYAPPVVYGPPAAHVQSYESGYGASSSYGSSYQQGSYYYGQPTSSTVTTIIQMPPTVTTTVIEEEIVEEAAVTTSYVRAAPRRVIRRAAPKRHRAKVVCCRCVCR